MKLRFRSKLGHRVEHTVRSIGLNKFETMNGSRLVMEVNAAGVHLIGGHSTYSIADLDWRSNQNAHWYQDPVHLGYSAEVL